MAAGCAPPGEPLDAPLVWRLDALDAIEGCATEVSGAPRVEGRGDTAALVFDGVDDALVVDCNPLLGLREFTVEVVFRPDAGGPAEQRFVHVQERGSKNRLLIETRVRGETWFLDTFLRTDEGEHTLFAKEFRHPLDRWHHAAVVVGGGRVRHFVDGRAELGRAASIEPLGRGRVSIGARINAVSWYRGAIREVRFTPRALRPEEFQGVGWGAPAPVEPSAAEGSSSS